MIQTDVSIHLRNITINCVQRHAIINELIQDGSSMYMKFSENTMIPLQSVSLGSGSHSPLAMHVLVLDPVNTMSLGHVNVTLVPCRAGSL